jgi:hypothetical protein
MPTGNVPATRCPAKKGGEYHYRVTVEWTGNRDRGTPHSAGYDRDINAEAKPAIAGSFDPAFRGDPVR